MGKTNKQSQPCHVVILHSLKQIPTKQSYGYRIMGNADSETEDAT